MPFESIHRLRESLHATRRRPHRATVRAPHRPRPRPRPSRRRRPGCRGRSRRADDGFTATAYEVEVTPAGGEPAAFTVESAEQVLVPWPAAPLRSRQAVAVRVRVARRRRRVERLERAGRRRGRPAPRRRLDGPVRQPAHARRPGRRRRRCCAARSTCRGEVVRARLYVTAHGVYRAELNGRRVGDDVLAPGLDQLRAPAALPDLRRHRPGPRRRQRARRPARQRLVPRPARLPRRGAPSTATGWPLLAQLEVTTADGAGARARHRRHLDRRARPTSSPTTSTTASAPTCAAPARPTDTPTRSTSSTPTSAGWSRRTARRCASPRCCPPVAVDHLAVRQDPRRLRAEPRRLGPAAGARRAGGRRGRAAPRRGARGRRARHPAAAHRARPPTRYMLAGGDEVVLEPRFTFHGFRYAEVTGVAGPATPTDVEAVVVGTDMRRTGWFDVVARRCSTASTRTSSGACAATSSTCPPTARSATSGSAGPATSRSSRPPRASCTTAPASSPPGSPTSPPSSSTDGSVPFVVPDVLRHAAARRPRPGATPPRSCRGCSTSAPATSSVLAPAVAEHARLGRPDRRRSPATDRLWAGGFQFGDWLDPTAPPDDPARRKADPDVVATAYLARSAELVAQAAALLGDADDRAALRATSPPRSREAFAARVRHRRRPGAQRRADRLRARAASGRCCPTAEQRERRRPTGWPTWSRTAGFRISTGFVGTPLIADALTDAGDLDAGVPAAAADRVPVVALPGDDGRDDDLGALGQHAARRHASTRAR